MTLEIQLTEDEFERVASDVVGAIVMEAQRVMHQRIEAAGFKVTGDLLRSLQHYSIIQARDLYAEFTIGFNGYGRFKDMRQLLYEKMPPIEVMEKFIEEVGVDNFKYVPGYLLGAKYRVLHIPDSRAINRIAWGIARSRLFTAKIRHHKRGAFYNPVRGKLIYETSYKMLEALPEPIMRAIKMRLEGE